jgi:hypothetical protein
MAVGNLIANESEGFIEVDQPINFLKLDLFVAFTYAIPLDFTVKLLKFSGGDSDIDFLDSLLDVEPNSF